MQRAKPLSMLAPVVLIATACGGGPGGNTDCSTSCAGCCANNVCQPGTTSAYCGKSGAACSACAGYQVCGATQACGLDPNGMWKVQPTSAQIAADDEGSTWDGDGSAPDVFVALTCPGSPPTSASTPIVESYSPTWTSGGCTARASDLLDRKFIVQLWDEDAVSDDPITSELTPSSLTEGNFASGSVPFSARDGMRSLTILLQKQ